MTPKQLERIAVLCEEHRRMDCPGMVLPVAQIQELVSAYRTAQRIRHQGLAAVEGHDTEMAHNLFSQLPEGGDWPRYDERNRKP